MEINTNNIKTIEYKTIKKENNNKKKKKRKKRILVEVKD